ncbi:MAG: nucleotidyltransferase domain-containing protein [Patescibacteria group bacterium]
MTDLDIVLSAINKSLNPQKVILFGSRARGDSNQDSDIDLAILQKDAPKAGQRAKVYRTLWEMGYNWKKEPDIHLFSEQNFNDRLKNNSFFIREIMKGKVLYAV